MAGLAPVPPSTCAYCCYTPSIGKHARPNKLRRILTDMMIYGRFDRWCSDVGRAVGVGEGRSAGVPQAAADAGADGAGGAAHHQVGQGQGARVPARVARLRGLHQRPARVHRRRPHRRGRLQGAAAPGPGPGRRHPGVQAPQGDQRLLLAPGARRGASLSICSDPARVYVHISGPPPPPLLSLSVVLCSRQLMRLLLRRRR
jgi:hypothetical protein